MKSDQPDNEKEKTFSRFPYRPEAKYLAIFLPAILSIPVMTTVIFYYFLLPAWSEPSSQEFQNIKGILVKHGNLSSNQGEKFSLRNISTFSLSSNSYAGEAVRLAQLDIGGTHLWLKLILPLVVVLGGFIWLTFRYRIPGVSKIIYPNIRKEQEKHLDDVEDKTLDFLNNYNGVIITVNGFIISILGGFLISSGSNNFYFFLGFEIIVFSLISSLLAYPSFISFGFIRKIKEKTSDEYIRLYRPILKNYFKIATFTSTCLILGLVIVVASLV
jgi:hypothetical protein